MGGRNGVESVAGMAWNTQAFVRFLVSNFWDSEAA
jgi:hypothetical protein